MDAAIMWNCRSGSTRSGRDLQKATMWATAKLSRPFLATAYFSISPSRRGPRASWLTATQSGFSRHWQPIMKWSCRFSPTPLSS